MDTHLARIHRIQLHQRLYVSSLSLNLSLIPPIDIIETVMVSSAMTQARGSNITSVQTTGKLVDFPIARLPVETTSSILTSRALFG